MLNDRMPRRDVDIDEINGAEEMTVSLSIREIQTTHPDLDLSRCADAEPWVRVHDSDDQYISIGVHVINDEEDGA